jgi:hypothetical protein
VFHLILHGRFCLLLQFCHLSPRAVGPQQISAGKMLYPQRELSDWQNYPIRTIQDISPAPKPVSLDQFGGRVDRHFTRTGFYYTRKIDGRWWFIDPDGHPYLNAAIDAVAPASSPASASARLCRLALVQVPGQRPR